MYLPNHRDDGPIPAYEVTQLRHRRAKRRRAQTQTRIVLARDSGSPYMPAQCLPAVPFLLANPVRASDRRTIACAACHPACWRRTRFPPLKPTTSMIVSASSRIVTSVAGADVVEPSVMSLSIRNTQASAMSSTYRNSRIGLPEPQTVNALSPRSLGFVRLADQGRQHVAVLEVVVVVGTIEIGRHDAQRTACRTGGCSFRTA